MNQFDEDVRAFVGSMLTPSGKLRSTPASYKDAYRYACDMWRKTHHRRYDKLTGEEYTISEVSILNGSDTGMVKDEEKALELAALNNMRDTQVSLEDVASYNDLVNQILNTLEADEKDFELCRYFCALIERSCTSHHMTDETRYRVSHYLMTMDRDANVGTSDKDIAVALNYRISDGSQCRKLASIKKRLLQRLENIGITRFSILQG